MSCGRIWARTSARRTSRARSSMTKAAWSRRRNRSATRRPSLTGSRRGRARKRGGALRARPGRRAGRRRRRAGREGEAHTGRANLFRGARFPVPLAALVAARLHGKHMVNDADAAALAERWVGAARGFERAAVLTLGTGVGCGLFLGGDVPLRTSRPATRASAGPTAVHVRAARGAASRPTPRRRPS